MFIVQGVPRVLTAGTGNHLLATSVQTECMFWSIESLKLSVPGGSVLKYLLLGQFRLVTIRVGLRVV
jgi:hypothetical protein